MPTGTFFRLPEEKRRRLMEAAWEEFTRTSYTDASINKIIQMAGIPRGSFYQYFEGKDDLFFHLLDDVRRHFIQLFGMRLDQAGGDLFVMQMLVYDYLARWRDSEDPALRRCIQVLRINPGMDMLQSVAERPELLPDELWPKIDTSRFRRRDRAFVEAVFNLTVMSLASAIVETLTHPGDTELQRKMLRERIEVLRHGSLDMRPVEPQTQEGGNQA